MKFAFILILFFVRAISLRAENSSLSEEALLNIKFDQKTGTQIPAGLVFHDETGQSVTLNNYFGNKPTILILGYYGCPMLCTLVLNGVMENLRKLDQATHTPYQLIFVSIDPAETPQLAAAKKQTYSRGYGGNASDWHFLTGNTNSIRQLTEAAGFYYAYDPVAQQYAHPSGFLVLTPAGKISRYFTGVTYSAKELNEALQQAKTGGESIESSSLNLLCFHYAPITGKYGKLALDIVRAGGIITFVALACFLFLAKNKRGGYG